MAKRTKKQLPKPGNRADRKRREREQQFRVGMDAPQRGAPVAGLKKGGATD